VVEPGGVTMVVPPGVVVVEGCCCGTTTVVFLGGGLLVNERQPASATGKKSARNRVRCIRASCYSDGSDSARGLGRIGVRTPSCRGALQVDLIGSTLDGRGAKAVPDEI
jgi:hypothetical protein